MKDKIVLILKGMAMGAANVIPGVSGGTIALITGIFERLINAIKSFDLKAIKLLLKGDIKGFFKYTDLVFVILVFGGAILSVFSLAVVLDYFFENNEVELMAFFFGLILASVYFVAKSIDRWSISVIVSFLIGAALASTIAFLTPATENSSFLYLVLCGVVAICSMILPGLSGSYVLLLMGNYKLVMIDAIKNVDVKLLFPVAIGAGVGLIAFSRLLSFVYKKFKDQTISVLSGFILGSLIIIWPWKTTITQTFGDKIKPIGYDWYLPTFNADFFIALGLIVLGIAAIWATETFGSKAQKN